MDPSGMGTCAQARPSDDEYKAQHLPIKMSLAGASPEVVDDLDSITAANGGLQQLGAESSGGKADELLQKTKEQQGWRKVIRNFTPS